MAVRYFKGIRPEVNGRPVMTIGSESLTATKQSKQRRVTRDGHPALCLSVYLPSEWSNFTEALLPILENMGRRPPSKSRRVVVVTRRRGGEAKGGRFLAFSEGQPTCHSLILSLSPSITQAGDNFDEGDRKDQQRPQLTQPAVGHRGIYPIHIQEDAIDNEQDRRTRSQEVLGQEASIQAEWQSQGRQGGRGRWSI